MKPIAALLFLLSSAPIAHADANDETFINTLTLNQLGCTVDSFLTCSHGEASLIDLGKDICDKMRSDNMSESTAVATLMRAAAKQNTLPLTETKATVFVRAAESSYCPDVAKGTTK